MTLADARDFLGCLVTCEIDRPLGSRHPRLGFRYPINYGYVPGHFSPDGEELDVYVLGVDRPLAAFTGRCIAFIRRREERDDKLVLVPDGIVLTDAEILIQVDFQERFFTVELVRT